MENTEEKNSKRDFKKLNKKIKIPIIIVLFVIIFLILISVVLNEELLKIEPSAEPQNTTPENIINPPSIDNGNKPEENQNKTKVDTNKVIIVEEIQNPTEGGEKPETEKPPKQPESGNTTEPEEPIEPEEPEEPVVENVYTIISENKQWEEMQSIDIFTNEYYTNAVIAPGVEGNYKFDVNNGLVITMKYNIQLEEINNKNINMKYRLKLGDTYIIEDWTDIENIEIPTFQINSMTKAKYTLEWKWVDSENDTQIGKNAEDAQYNLKILVTSTEL